jgi:heptose I phosphotransferase
MATSFQCEPDWQAALRAARLDDFDAVMRAAAGPAASRHAARETAPVTIERDGEARRLFLKRVFRVPPRHALGPWVRFRAGRSQPMIEWEMLGRLSAAGIPAMRRVAWGERRRMGVPLQAFLMVEAAPMRRTLEEWLVPGFSRSDGRDGRTAPSELADPHELSEPLRRRLVRDLGRLVGELHGAGFRWPDIAAKHVFAEPRGEGWRFCLIDVERMRLASPEAPPFTDFDRLLRSFWPLAISPRDLARFAAGYVSANDLSPMARAGRRRVRSWRPRLEPMPRLPDDYEHPRAMPIVRGGRMMVDGRMAPALREIGLCDMGSLFAFAGGERLDKPGLRGYRERFRVALRDGPSGCGTVYLKRYRSPPFREQLRRIGEWGAGLSSAGREAKCIKKLLEIGVPTMRLLAFGQKMRGPMERRSFILTAAVAGESLERMAQGGAIDAGDRREIVRQLALIARLMHGRSLFHRDLYLSHVFCARNRNGEIVLTLIDLARMIERPLFPSRWRIKDLAALDYSAGRAASRTDRLRFLYHYLPTPADRTQIRRLSRVVRERADRMTRHDARRRRRLEGPRSA